MRPDPRSTSLTRTAVASVVAAVSLAAAPTYAASPDDHPVVGLGGGVLAGTVTGSDGTALAGVCVSVEANGGDRATRTDVAGRWLVTDVPTGAVALAFNDCLDPVPGHAATWWPDASSPETAHLLVVEPHALLDGLDVRLGAAATVAGAVVGPAGAAVAGACVTARDATGATVGRATTAADGRYRLTALPTSVATILVRDCGAAPTATPVEVAVTPTRGAVTQAPTATMGRGGAIVGQVRADHTGAPVSGACVTLWSAEPTVAASLYRGTAVSGTDPVGRPTDVPGRYAFTGVAPGRYRVFFGFDLCSAEDGYDEEWYDDRSGPAIHATDAVTEIVEVAADEVVTGIDASLRPVPSTAPGCPYPPALDLPDVDPEGAHGPGVACAVAFGILPHPAGAAFSPTRHVTRAEVATALTRSIAVVRSSVLRPDPADAFDDDAGSPDEVALDQLAGLGILLGTAPRSVEPDRLVTRGQLASLLLRTYETVTGTTLRPGEAAWLDDVGVHADALARVGGAGLIAGTTPSQVRPDDPVRRDQLATVLARLVSRIVGDG